MNESNSPRLRGRWRIVAAALLLTVAADRAGAGGGPENVALVVNQDSWASMSLANEYIHLRRIPAGNIFYLHLGEFRDQANLDVSVFRNKILVPVLDGLRERELTPQVDYIVYSCDIPYALNVQADVGTKVLPKVIKPVGSITGLTYLYHRVLSRDTSYLSLDVNRYARLPLKPAGETNSSVTSLPADVLVQTQATSGFRSHYAWDAQGKVDPLVQGDFYMLSAMLGWTSGRGNSLAEVVDSLRRSASADGTCPKGTIYYMKNQDVRTKIRQWGFPSAVALLKELGVKATIADGILPNGKTDIAGLMSGTVDFDFKSSGCKILPGAFCEDLTSYGGILQQDAIQTPLTEWIRWGAAGSCGSVIEPFAMQQKFPMPFLHVHYARGCSLAEAYYQSVMAPYQLLLVGDPLCRPWARIPQVRIPNLRDGDTIKGRLLIAPAVKDASATPVDKWELYVDGKPQASVRGADKLDLDTTAISEGYHELRVVATSPPPIQTQGAVVLDVQVKNDRGGGTAKAEDGGNVAWPGTARITASVPGARAIMLYHNGRLLANVTGQKGQFAVDTKTLGIGPVKLLVVGLVADAGKGRTRVACAPVKLTVAPPAAMKALSNVAADKLRPGLLLRIAQASHVIVPTGPEWLSRAGVMRGQAFEIEGIFQTAADDLYQFQVYLDGTFEIKVDDQTLGAQASDGPWRSFPVSLSKGYHRLLVKAVAQKSTDMDIRFGAKGTRYLDQKAFTHAQ